MLETHLKDDDNNITNNKRGSAASQTTATTTAFVTIATATSTVRRNPIFGLENEAMENYTHIEKPDTVSPSARSPQFMSSSSPTDQSLSSINSKKADQRVPQDHSNVVVKSLAQTIVSASLGVTNAKVALGDM